MPDTDIFIKSYIINITWYLGSHILIYYRPDTDQILLPVTVNSDIFKKYVFKFHLFTRF